MELQTSSSLEQLSFIISATNLIDRSTVAGHNALFRRTNVTPRKYGRKKGIENVSHEPR
jgi:hypothetical protein